MRRQTQRLSPISNASDRAINWVKSIHPVVQDGLLALVLAATLLVDLVEQELPGGGVLRPADPLAYVLVPMLVLPLALRRIYPVPVYLVIFAVANMVMAIGYAPTSVGFGLIVATYTVARWCERRTALTVFALSQLFGIAIKLRLALAGIDIAWFEWPLDAVYFGAAWFLGDTIRTKNRYAEELERNREQLARQAVEAEQVRIARELHDIVAHSLSVITVQAGAGAHIADQDPTRAKQALQAIEESSRQALAEMRRLLDVLRIQTDDERLLAPQPGLDRLPELIANVEDAGLRVTLRVEGERGQIPESTDLAGYRIVQEALTNTLKHAGAVQAAVVIRYRRKDVQVEVWDTGALPGRRDNASSEGYGLRGMAERVALYGGEFEAGPQAGRGFRVRARLPLESAGPHK